jgi:hypothetical protein
MGLKVETSMEVFKGKKLVYWTFNAGNEYTLHLEDSKGKVSRVRVPSYFKDILETFAAQQWWVAYEESVAA